VTGVDHGHQHGLQAERSEDRRRLRWVLGVTLAVLVVEVVGALITGSLALLADAGHMLTDSAAVAIALVANHLATLPSTDRRTFGLHRAEILAALTNAVTLVVLCGYLAVSAVRRLGDPPEIDGGLMLAVALFGLLGNVVALLLLRARKDATLNMRAAYLEVLTDGLGSLAVVAAAVLVIMTGFDLADPIATLLISALVLPRAFLLLREAVDVLLEATPRHLDMNDIRGRLEAIDGVITVHDLHVWTITSGLPSLSAHVVVDDDVLDAGGLGRMLDRLCACVGDGFDLQHTTFQVEPASHHAHEELGIPHP
jgi:cobalt-zinc-cadmium efflux system protein